MVRHLPPMASSIPQQTAAIAHLSEISHHVDALEELTDAEFFTIAHGSPQALGNLLARLDRLKLTIELAAAA
jgi:hypothetical protein